MTTLNIFQKLLEVRKSVIYLQKESQGHQYQYTGSSQVLAAVRTKLDELGLYLTCEVIGHNIIDGKTAKGGREVTTELDLEFTWINVENPEEKVKIKWYGQGVDNAEKGVGKALTYAEKYFMLKQFNIATDKDDPDSFQEKAETYRKNEPSSPEQITDLKNKIIEFAQLRGRSIDDVYKAINVTDITKLTSQEADNLITNVSKWIINVKKELQ